MNIYAMKWKLPHIRAFIFEIGNKNTDRRMVHQETVNNMHSQRTLPPRIDSAGHEVGTAGNQAGSVLNARQRGLAYSKIGFATGTVEGFLGLRGTDLKHGIVLLPGDQVLDEFGQVVVGGAEFQVQEPTPDLEVMREAVPFDGLTQLFQPLAGLTVTFSSFI
jgi:hypothetical protein